jgi:predicted AlkP superfamily pyrophosphatase or phosphodiesterase
MRLLRAIALLLCASSQAAFAQNSLPAQPKLIVGIVVDQMRYDYLYRYRASYGERGFKRLLGEGFSCENTHYNYAPTYTGPGHAAIYTGTTPAVNGVIGNDWWDSEWRADRYVTQDKRYRTVGGTPDKVGQHSPAVMLSTTITDELRLSNNFRSKVVGICLKDRGSILPAGHIPNACYWFDDASASWITSTYYPDSLGLPQWVQDFNARALPDTFLSKPWVPLRPATERFAGWEKYSKGMYGSIQGGFPHDLASLKKKQGYGVLRYTPGANTLVTEFALEAIQRMSLGTDESPDFLCMSYSAPDYCGHQFGIHAEETEDLYLRLDLEIARLLDELDRRFGKNNVLVFLTADHGAAETPTHLVDLRISAGVLAEHELEEKLEKALAAASGVTGDFIHEVNNQQVWLNWEAMRDFDLQPEDVAAAVSDYLRGLPGVYDVLTRQELEMMPSDYPFISEIRRGIHPRRSGDIVFLLDPAWHADYKFFGKGGTTHGSAYAYDTHVPLVWRGWRIKSGETFAPVSITDIAPTLAALLRIMEPNGTTGQVIQEVMRN